MKKKLLLLGLIVTNMLTYGRNAQTQPSTPNYVTKEEFDVLKKQLYGETSSDQKGSIDNITNKLASNEKNILNLKKTIEGNNANEGLQAKVDTHETKVNSLDQLINGTTQGNDGLKNKVENPETQVNNKLDKTELKTKLTEEIEKINNLTDQKINDSKNELKGEIDQASKLAGDLEKKLFGDKQKCDTAEGKGKIQLLEEQTQAIKTEANNNLEKYKTENKDSKKEAIEQIDNDMKDLEEGLQTNIDSAIDMAQQNLENCKEDNQK